MAKLIKCFFSKAELINMRRFLNRAVDCCEGQEECPNHKWAKPRICWYVLRSPMNKIQKALGQKPHREHRVGRRSAPNKD